MIASRLDQFSNEHTLDKFATFALAQYQNKCAVMLNVVTMKIWEGQTVLVRKIMTKRETIWLIKRTQRPHLSLPQKLENAFKSHLYEKFSPPSQKFVFFNKKSTPVTVTYCNYRICKSLNGKTLSKHV